MDDIVSGVPDIETDRRLQSELQDALQSCAEGFILTDTWLRVVLQGFADSSEVAYGTVVYLQCFYQTDRAKVTILASKSRVAPIRVISIPRLELCACVLLAQLVQKIRSCIRLVILCFIRIRRLPWRG
ncbi:uncharacterized protein TNCT_98611 [Trichonephila clavata]|uniref:Uncharacterized protein n=1 Tax=Trichonephila clavata TaxID=2740835 RepID=A0A8X6L8W8_TRICU|nr:uncharacterized protein TNCT_98611 [Trichonephila clavata]